MRDKVTPDASWFLGLIQDVDGSQPVRIKKETMDALPDMAQALPLPAADQGVKRELCRSELDSTAARRRLLEPITTDEEADGPAKEEESDQPSQHF